MAAGEYVSVSSQADPFGNSSWQYDENDQQNK